MTVLGKGDHVNWNWKTFYLFAETGEETVKFGLVNFAGNLQRDETFQVFAEEEGGVPSQGN